MAWRVEVLSAVEGRMQQYAWMVDPARRLFGRRRVDGLIV